MKWFAYISFFLLTLSPLSSIGGTIDKIEIRKFDNKKIEVFQDNYDYYNVRKDKKKKKKNNTSSDTSSSGGGGNTTRNRGGSGSQDGNALMYIIFGVAMIGLVVMMLTSKGGLTFVSRNVRRDETHDGYDVIEDIHKMDIVSILDQAINNGEYRRATRLMYLDILKKLSTKKMIDWEENKTNRDYLYEIKNRKIRKEYEGATVMYEYVWYGDIDIDKEVFGLVSEKFKHVMKQIN